MFDIFVRTNVRLCYWSVCLCEDNWTERFTTFQDHAFICRVCVQFVAVFPCVSDIVNLGVLLLRCQKPKLQITVRCQFGDEALENVVWNQTADHTVTEKTIQKMKQDQLSTKKLLLEAKLQKWAAPVTAHPNEVSSYCSHLKLERLLPDTGTPVTST